MGGLRGRGGYSQALCVAGDAPWNGAQAQPVAVHASGGAGTLGGAGGSGGSAQDARQRQGQRQAGAHGGAGPGPPRGHGVQAPEPRRGCLARRDTRSPRRRAGGLGGGRRSWRGGGAGAALRRTGRGRSGARRAAAAAAAPSVGLALPRCASLTAPRYRASPGPSGSPAEARAQSASWAERRGARSPGKSGSGLGSGARRRLGHRVAGRAGRRSLSPFTEQSRHRRRGARPSRPPSQNTSSASHWLRCASRRLSWELCWSNQEPGGRRQQGS